MDFEFDQVKSDQNKLKHGLDFEEAKTIWNDPKLIKDAPANSEGEQRWFAIGKTQGKLWTATYTYRSERIRIISVRPARSEERWVYEN